MIISINKNAIAEAFKQQQGCDGEEYLRKFFQHNYNVEPLWHVLLEKRFFELVDDFYRCKNVQKEIADDDIEYILEHIESACDEIARKSPQKNVFDNRSIEEYLQKVSQVLFNLAAEKMNYAYLWVFCWMMLYRLFDKREFAELYAGKENDYEDIINSQWADPNYDTIFVSGGRDSYRRYHDHRHNGVNYMYNYINCRNTNYVNTINSRFSTMSLRCAIDQNIVKQILNEIDKYSE